MAVAEGMDVRVFDEVPGGVSSCVLPDLRKGALPMNKRKRKPRKPRAPAIPYGTLCECGHTHLFAESRMEGECFYHEQATGKVCDCPEFRPTGRMLKGAA
jgi:hypothetical protein